MILVQNLIYEVRGKRVMLDFDLARLYAVNLQHHLFFLQLHRRVGPGGFEGLPEDGEEGDEQDQ